MRGFNNMIFWHRTFCTLLVMGGLLPSCTTRPGKNGQASYHLVSVEGKMTPQESLQGWEMVKTQRFNFSVCLQDNARLESLKDHRFEVSGLLNGEPVSYQTATDPLGCLHWSEDISFDPLAKPTYIALERTLHPEGKQRGDRIIQIGVNPWAGFNGEEPPVVDLAKVQVAKLVKASESAKALRVATEDRLRPVIERVDISFNRDHVATGSVGLNAILELNFSVAVPLTDMAGIEKLMPLQHGSFTIKPYLLWEAPASAQGEKAPPVPVLADVAATEMILSNQTAHAVVPVTFRESMKGSGTYKLALVVAPKGGPASLDQFEGLFLIGDRSKVSAASLTLDPAVKASAKTFTLSSYVGAQFFSTLALPAPTPVAPFTTNVLNITPTGVGPESGSERYLKVTADIEMDSALDFRPLPEKWFTVSQIQADSSGIKRQLKVKTLSDGRLHWTDYVHHSYYSTQKEIPYVIEIADANNPELKIVKNFKMNPGDLAVTFAQDEVTQVTFSEFETPAFHKPSGARPTLNLPFNVCVNRSETQYEVSRNLELWVKHNYTAQATPEVLRYDNLATGLATPPEPLRPGYYLITALVLENDIVGNTVGPIVAGFQSVVYHQGSSLTNEIQLELKNLRFMALKNFLVLQIAPVSATNLVDGPDGKKIFAKGQPVIDTTSDLVTPSFVVPFAPSAETSCGTAQNIAQNIHDERVRKFVDELNGGKGKDAMALYREFAASHEAPSADVIVADENDGWRSIPERSGQSLHPFLVTSDNDISQQLKLEDVTQAQLRETLQCLDVADWSQRTHFAKCAKRPAVAKAAVQLCKSVLRLTMDNCNFDKVFDSIRGEQMTVVYKLARNELKASDYMGGFNTTLSVSNGFGLGSFYGSDFGGMDTNSISGSLDGTVGIDVGHGIHGGAGVGASASKSFSSFVIDFKREYKENLALIHQDANIGLESAQVQLSLARYRQCYSVQQKSGQGEGALICFPVETTPTTAPERYFFAYNSAPSGGLLDSADPRNRWLLNIRGERDFYKTMTTLSDNLAPYYYKQTVEGIGIPIEITKMLKEDYRVAQEKTRALPGVLRTLAPGQDLFKRRDDFNKDRRSFLDSFCLPHSKDMNDPDSKQPLSACSQ